MNACFSRWIQSGLIAILTTACNDADLMQSTQSPGRDGLALFETAVQSTRIREPIYTSGTVIPDKITDLTPGVSGPVEAVHVQVGDRVTAGQSLMQVEQTDYRLNVRQLENSVALARAEFTDAKMDLETNLDLSRQGAVSREVLDNVRTRHDMAKARLGIEEARFEQAIEALEDTVVRAPFDGIISRRNIDEGAWVQGRASPAAPLQIIKIDVVRIKAFVPETSLSRIDIGTAAAVTIDGLDRSWETEIDIINDLVDEQSRSIEIRMSLDNPDFTIKPGLFARVEIKPDSRQALVLDRSSIMSSEDPFVYVNDSGKARRTSVTIRDLDTGSVEVLKGLESGQKVLYGANLSRVQDDVPVRIIGG